MNKEDAVKGARVRRRLDGMEGTISTASRGFAKGTYDNGKGMYRSLAELDLIEPASQAPENRAAENPRWPTDNGWRA